MDELREKLKNGKILVCDGAMGTMLQSRGLSIGECPEEWNETHSEDVREIHLSYLDAGADIILTNTFGGNRLKLKTCGKEDKVREYNLSAIKNAYDAIDVFRRTTHNAPPARLVGKLPILTRGSTRRRKIYIFGDIGPTGQIMDSSGGTLTLEQAKDVFREQVDSLIACKVEGSDKSIIDGIIFETFEDIEEIKAGIIATKNVLIKNKISIPIITSMTFHSGAKGFRTIMGVTIEKAVKELEGLGIDVIGTNCGNGPDGVVEIIKEMRKFTDLPLIAEPNAGIPILKEGKTVFPLGPQEMAKFIPELIDSRVNIIGGCCGTTPEHIRKIKEVLNEN